MSDLRIFEKKEHHLSLLIPDHEHLMGYKTLDSRIDKAVASIPWEKKERIAFWRGGTSGGVFSEQSWKSAPRSKLTLISKNSPECLDAKFSSLVLGAEKIKPLLEKEGVVGSIVLPEDHLTYRFLIDIDGNASTYSRFYWILRSNCTPLKQVSCYEQWYYPLLLPYIHYIPFKKDLTDLQEKINWCLSHEEECRAIATQSREFAIDYLSEQSMFFYLYACLKKYEQLFNESVLPKLHQ